MKRVELYAEVRRAVQVEGMRPRRFGIDPKTVAKMLRFSVPPVYRGRKPPARPKLDECIQQQEKRSIDRSSFAAVAA